MGNKMNKLYRDIKKLTLVSSIFFLFVQIVHAYTLVGWQAYWPGGTLLSGGGNTSSMIIGITPPSSPTYTGFFNLQVTINSAALPAYANYLCIMPMIDRYSQTSFYLNSPAGIVGMGSSSYCQDRSTSNINIISSVINITSTGSHTIGALVFAGRKDSPYLYRFFDGVPVFSIDSNAPVVFQQVGEIPINVVAPPQLPPYVFISGVPNPTIQGTNISVSYRSNLSVLGTNAVSCTASSDSPTPLSNWNGSVPVSNSSNSLINNVGPINGPTRIGLRCFNSSGLSGYAETIITTYVPCYDSGLRIRGAGQTYKIGMDSGVPVSPIRISKNGLIIGLKLVDVSSSDASPFRVRTSNGIRALQRCI